MDLSVVNSDHIYDKPVGRMYAASHYSPVTNRIYVLQGSEVYFASNAPLDDGWYAKLLSQSTLLSFFFPFCFFQYHFVFGLLFSFLLSFIFLSFLVGLCVCVCLLFSLSFLFFLTLHHYIFLVLSHYFSLSLLRCCCILSLIKVS